jgi:hypothetical protein
MQSIRISNEAARRYILGRQGLWPGRRWAGKSGVAPALRYIEALQMDPLNVIGRSHDLALWGRVLEYNPKYLDALMYEERQFFEYGGNLRVYPMEELPYWRGSMHRKAKTERWANFAKEHRSTLKAVKAALRERGPLGNRNFHGLTRVSHYRGRKESSLALYYLWLAGELMVHHRFRFERVYDFLENIAPASLQHVAKVGDSERFFSRKAFAFRGLCTAKSWASSTSFFLERKISSPEAQRWLTRMISAGEVVGVTVEGEKEPYYLLVDDVSLLEAVVDGHVPKEWQPLETTTEEEVLFLAPLETVIAHGRAKSLFGFDYIWEVYKPAAKRRWGYYTLPILYDDQLVARLDPMVDSSSDRVVIKALWLENEATGKDVDFIEALARGLARLTQFVNARTVDVSAVKPTVLRRDLQSSIAAIIARS